MQGASGGVNNEMSGVTARVAVQAQVANFITLAGGASAPGVAQAEEAQQVVLPDLRRCAAALGVPPEEVDAVADWLGRPVDDGPWRPSPIALPPEKAAELEAFASHLRCFAQPESALLGMALYVSDGKIDAMYGPLAHRLGDTDRPAERFRRLHRHLAAQGRMVFGPACLLAGAELPRSEASWLFFDGRFSLTDEIRPIVLQAYGPRFD